jgi:hypothetical protein
MPMATSCVLSRQRHRDNCPPFNRHAIGVRANRTHYSMPRPRGWRWGLNSGWRDHPTRAKPRQGRKRSVIAAPPFANIRTACVPECESPRCKPFGSRSRGYQKQVPCRCSHSIAFVTFPIRSSKQNIIPRSAAFRSASSTTTISRISCSFWESDV